MKAIVLSTFDTVKGPTSHFFLTDSFIDETRKEGISSMINFKASKEYFIVRVNALTTYNIQFTLRSSIARGNLESLMLSFVSEKFPSRSTERYFLTESASFIAYMQKETCSEFIFHLDNQFNDEEACIVEKVYDESLRRLKDTLDRFP
jgi:hypothetical protein